VGVTLFSTENAELDAVPAPTQPAELFPFVGGVREGMPDGLPFYLADYLDLVNWTGRAVREDKREAIAEDLQPILERIGITRAAWLELAQDFGFHMVTVRLLRLLDPSRRSHGSCSRLQTPEVVDPAPSIPSDTDRHGQASVDPPPEG